MKTLTENDFIEILEGIARDSSNAAARIAAIKALRELDVEGEDAGDFDSLDELAARRKAS